MLILSSEIIMYLPFTEVFYIPASAVSSISHVFEYDPGKSKEAEDLLEYIER